MKKYTAIRKNGSAIMDTYATDIADAERVIGILLRGRPGIDYYKMWEEDGKLILEAKNG
ncbi:hypothetical protein LCGC14_1773620 [marine sediment metagenome]|uniref:Uncharacterized protein n=1 Tax=marine sediment metagenome TaxID=412755 RepID=A0A0F9JX72_9ZZZZ